MTDNPYNTEIDHLIQIERLLSERQPYGDIWAMGCCYNLIQNYLNPRYDNDANAYHDIVLADAYYEWAQLEDTKDDPWEATRAILQDIVQRAANQMILRPHKRHLYDICLALYAARFAKGATL